VAISDDRDGSVQGRPPCAGPGVVTGRSGDPDSSSDRSSPDKPVVALDPNGRSASAGREVRTNIPDRLERPLPDEALLVYHHLKDRLADLFSEIAG
jgi:hypothetical protein